MGDVTDILSRVVSGSPEAADKLLPLVYDELRQVAAARMSAERPDHILQATALVHEAYVRLLDSPRGLSWDNRGHFFAAAAEAMRRILIDSARANMSLKRGGDRIQIDLQDFAAGDSRTHDLLLDLDEGLTLLANEDGEAAELVKLRLFAGLSVTEAGQVMGIARTAAYENWEFARSWFAMHLDHDFV